MPVVNSEGLDSHTILHLVDLNVFDNILYKQMIGTSQTYKE